MSDKYEFRLNEAARIFAFENIGETDEIREEAIDKIKQQLLKEPELHARTDDYSILLFLRTCKFDYDKTIKKIRSYYELKAKVPEWYINRDPNIPEVKELLKLGVFVPILLQNPGPLIVIVRTGAHDPAKHKQNDVFKTGKMLLDLALENYESASIYGVYAIFDMKNVTYSHAKQLNPYMIKNAVSSWQNYHCRPQLLEFVNAPSYINVVLNVFRSFMSQKMKERVHIHHSALDDLYKDIPKYMLPEEYGGTNGPLQKYIDYWYDKAIENKAWYQESEKYKPETVK